MSNPPQPDSVRSTIHWPGPIPREIKLHPKTDLSQDELREEIKGWLPFVQESRVPRDQANISAHNNDCELRQRRAIVQKCASESQGSRYIRAAELFQPFIKV